VRGQLLTSIATVLKIFFELCSEIDIFMTEKPLSGCSFKQFMDLEGSFSHGLSKHLNYMNLKLHGEDCHILDLYPNVKAFRQKLVLFYKQIS
jgi:hypothetical protein